MHRFFVTPELLASPVPVAGTRTMLSLPKPIAHQLRDVLHLAIGEQLLLLDNSGDEVLATIATSSRTDVVVQLLYRRAVKSEPAVRIILYQALLISPHFQ